MTYCPYCGTVVQSSAKFCGECGESLPTVTDSKPEGTDQTDHSSSLGNEVADGDVAETTSDSPNEYSLPKTSDTSLGGRFWINGAIGGIVGLVLAIAFSTAFFPVYFVGIIGGAFLAGALHNRGTVNGATVGMLAAVLSTIPFILAIFGIIILGMGWITLGGVVPPHGGEIVAGLGILGLLFAIVSLAINIVCGLLGGALGGAVAN